MRPVRAPLAGISTVATVAVLAWSATAAPQAPDAAPPDKEACASAHEQAQVARKHGRLLEARGKLQLCAADACPMLARQDCGVWLVEIDERLPTIVIAAKDVHGAPTTAVRCALDGEPLFDHVGASPLAINPGAHTLKCAMEGAAPVEQALSVVEGEKGRHVDVSFEPPKPAEPPAPVPLPSASTSTSPSVAPPPFPPPLPSRGVSVATYGLAGLAVLGLGGFAYFGLGGLSDENNLRTTCKHACNPSDVSAVTTKYHVADAALAVGVIAAGVAGWLYFSRPAAPGASQTGARIGVQAMPGGGGARVELRF